MVGEGVRQGHTFFKKTGFIKTNECGRQHGERLMERGRNEGWEGGVKFFQISFFFPLWSFTGDYVFQRDLNHAATRLDHQASETQKADIDIEIEE